MSEKTSSRLLVIDDNEKDVLMLRMMLAEVKGMKFDISSTDQVSTAFDQLKNKPFDIVLLSLTLKGTKSLEALEQIQNDFPHLPVVILTGLDSEPIALEALRRGAQDFLVKGRLDGNLLSRVIHYALERYRVMREMKEKNKELERLNSLKSEFVSTVSHELRTPLTVVMSATNNLLDGAFGAMNEGQEKWVRKISHHAMRLHGMISDLLDLSKLQSGKSELKRERVDLSKLAETTVTQLQTIAKEKRINLTVETPRESCPVWGDRGRLEQVLTNLITNAFKFTPEEGHVRVKVKKNGENEVQVTVSDTGPGIAPENQALIFEKFRQIRSEEPKESSTKGIGLGLAICKEIVHQHQGRIWVESEMGKGSSFIFAVPTDARAGWEQPVNVLVVDDDDEVCTLLSLTLSQAGYHVSTAKNGKQAIQLVEDRNHHFDLIFLDLMLPGANGVEVIQSMKATGRHTEVVIVTAYPNSDLLFKSMEQGPLTIIAKPFKPEKVLEVVAKLVSRSRRQMPGSDSKAA